MILGSCTQVFDRPQRYAHAATCEYAAIEYQGHRHYQGTAAARDAVKKEALRKAGVRYIEVTAESGTEDMAREISRIAQAERLKAECFLQ